MPTCSFLVWSRDGGHSVPFARQIGASIGLIHWHPRGWTPPAPLRYLVQSVLSWRWLCQERPDVVFVQNPPVFAVLVAALYARLHGGRYAISSHSGAFLAPNWRWALGLHRRLSRGAMTTIVHNRDIRAMTAGWGCRTTLLGFVPQAHPAAEHFPLREGRFSVAMVASGSPDEPLGALFQAAAALPDVDFYVTGRLNRVAPAVLAERPANCHLTGYMPLPRYTGLLTAADVVMALTTDDHTVLNAGFEAACLGTPLVTSDWSVLREYFDRGTVHVANTADGIRGGVERARRESGRLRAEVPALRARLQYEWEVALGELHGLLSAPPIAEAAGAPSPRPGC